MDIALKAGTAPSGGHSGSSTNAAPLGRRHDPLPGETIGQKFWNAVQARGPAVALRQKELGIWEEVTWTELGRIARSIAMGLASIGFEPGHTASILSNTRREWSYADYGVLTAGGVSSGIYPTDAAPQVEYLCADSNTSVLFVEDDEQLDKALTVRDRLPGLRRIVVFDMEGLADLADPMAQNPKTPSLIIRSVEYKKWISNM